MWLVGWSLSVVVRSLVAFSHDVGSNNAVLTRASSGGSFEGVKSEHRVTLVLLSSTTSGNAERASAVASVGAWYCAASRESLAQSAFPRDVPIV